MSTQTVVESTSNTLRVNSDVSKIFVGNNDYDTFTYKNGTGASIDLVAGTVMGRISATGATKGYVVPCDAQSSDGSQYPIGILLSDRTVANNETIEVSVCVKGDVVESKVVFVDTEYTDLDTVVDGRLLRDRIGSDSVGIKLVGGDELTAYDNN